MSNVTTEYIGQRRDEKGIKARWWLEPKEEMGRNAFAVAAQISENQSYRRTQNLRYARLYSNLEILGLQAGTYARTASQNVEARVTLNVVRACVDTAASKIAKNRPRPMFLTSGGDWKTKKRAKKLTKYIDGLFDQAKVYPIGQQCFVDACVFGTGVMHLYKEGSTIRAERVLSEEILVDDAEGIYGEPRQLHRSKYVHREVLLDLFGKDKALRQAINDAPAGMPGDNTSVYAADLIAVVESWHLRSGPNAKDGRRCLSIKGTTLVSEEWTKDYFPFVFQRWSPRLVGFYGSGLAEELVGIQIEINKILRNIQRAQALVAVPRVFVENGSQVNLNHINNQISAVIKYTGKPPVFDTPTAMTGEIYAHLDRLFNKAFEIAGISQLSATSKKPAGLDSGVALREYNDIESERFAVTGQRYEQFFIDAADIAVDMSHDLYAENPDLMVHAPGKGFIETIKWKEVSMKKDAYIMRVFPTSILPTTPAGRLQVVQELIQGGFISKEEGLALLDFPDLERTLSLANAAVDDTMELLERIVEEGTYFTPEPYQNLQLCVRLGQSMYLKARSDKVPEDRLELLRRFIDDANALITPATPEPAPAVETPMAQPEALPTSELLPVGAANFQMAR
jgi:Bacteriophage head to tail connecting protein